MTNETPATETPAAEFPAAVDLPLTQISEPTLEPVAAPVAGVPDLPSSTDGFFNSIRRLNLVRTSDRWVGGVAAGIAHRLGWDPLIVRGIFFISFFFGGLGLIAYGVAWALLPEASDGRIHLQEAIRGRFDPALIGAGLLVFSGMVSNGPLSWVTNRVVSTNWQLFNWIGGLFTAVFWIVVAGLVFRWLRDQRYYRRFRKTTPNSAVTAGFPQSVRTGLSTDVEPAVVTPALVEIDDAVTLAEVPVVDNAVLDDAVDVAGGTGLVAASVMNDVAETVMAPSKAELKAAAKVDAEQRAAERAALKDQAREAKAYDRQQQGADRAFERQQREIERYQRALERSRKPITKGPGVVTVLLTLGALFLAWTVFQAINGGLIPTAVGALGNPLLWVGITLLIIGVAIFISGIRGRKSGTLAGLSWLALIVTLPITFLVPGVFGGAVAWGNGTTDWVRPAETAQALASGVIKPANLAQAERGFRGQFGSSTLDLTSLDLSQSTPNNPAVVPIEFSAGDLTVLVPEGAAVEANVRLSGGQVGWQTWTGTYQDFERSGFSYERVDYVDDSGTYSQVFTQNVNTPSRAPVFLASESAREHGADLRLVIGAGAGSIIIREVPPVAAAQSTVPAASSETN